MARQYDVKGSKNFLAWAIGLLLLGLWCVKDGWFPSESVLVRHPLSDPESVRFYAFNKSLAIFSLIGSVVCGYIHRLVK